MVTDFIFRIAFCYFIRLFGYIDHMYSMHQYVCVPMVALLLKSSQCFSSNSAIVKPQVYSTCRHVEAPYHAFSQQDT